MPHDIAHPTPEDVQALLGALRQAAVGLIDAREGEEEYIQQDIDSIEMAIQEWDPTFDAEACWQENEDSKEDGNAA